MDEAVIILQGQRLARSKLWQGKLRVPVEAALTVPMFVGVAQKDHILEGDAVHHGTIAVGGSVDDLDLMGAAMEGGEQVLLIAAEGMTEDIPPEDDEKTPEQHQYGGQDFGPLFPVIIHQQGPDDESDENDGDTGKNQGTAFQLTADTGEILFGVKNVQGESSLKRQMAC